jgi:hypothetical protein
MAQLIQPNNVKVITKDGEIQVSLTIDLNITLNQTGTINVEGGINSVSGTMPKTVKSADDDKVEWAIPDFVPEPRVKFGK